MSDWNPQPETSPFKDAPKLRKLSLRSEWFLQQLQDGVFWPEECVPWPWSESDRRHTLYFKGEAIPVTHAVLHFHVGPRPTKKHQGLHSCDQGWCINALHLRWDTELANRLDQVARQRGSIGRIGLGTAYKVRDELKVISKKYGVPMDAIARIASTKSWSEDSWTETEETDASQST